MHTFKQYKGILFIGDPHLWSRKPDRRRDVSFQDTVLNKLMQAADIARREKLYVVILGDLFHDDRDRDTEMLVKLTRVLQAMGDDLAVTLVGNHEKSQQVLTDDTALALLRESNTIFTIEKTSVFAKFIIGDKNFYLGGTPYGQKIPDDIRPILPKNERDKGETIWITHHDLAFEKTYPGAVKPIEIQHCFLAVNGHVHQEQKPIQTGQTCWWNPGNITRLSIDCAQQKPKVWKWTPEQGNQLEGIPLVYQENIFNDSDRRFEVPTQYATAPIEQGSRFVKMMITDEDKDFGGDAEKLQKAISALAQASNLAPELLNDLSVLFREAQNNETPYK